MAQFPKFTRRAAQQIEELKKAYPDVFTPGKYVPMMGFAWPVGNVTPTLVVGAHEVEQVPDDMVVECHGVRLAYDLPDKFVAALADCVLDFDGEKFLFVLSDPDTPTLVVVDAFDHIVLNVRDVETSAAWYESVLGMKRVVTEPKPGRPVTSMHFGRQKINLRPADTIQEVWFTGRKIAPGSDDLCFLVQMSPREVVRHLWACKIFIEEGPSEKSGAQGTLISVYCRDPDGNLIEISSYK